jgi:hypothetical protein
MSPWIGAGADDGHFDHQVVVGFRFQARQHVDLSPGFHLEHADAVAFLEHGVGGPVFLGHVLDLERLAFLLADQFQGPADGRKHAQGEYVHFHQAQAFQVVLVPLDHGAVGHGGVFHRHQFGQRAGADDEAAHVLGQVPGESRAGCSPG